MISLENVRIFLKTVETNSFSAAGRMLRLSPSVVSYRIQMLEEALGARLLTRTTRTMRLTEAGQTFLEHCREIVDAVERAEASVAEANGVSAHGVLRVTAPLGLGRRVIAPMMASFRLAFWALSRTSGSCTVTSWSTMKRLMPRIDTGASTVERRHLSSQVWKQTREQTAAKGFRSRCSRSASA